MNYELGCSDAYARDIHKLCSKDLPITNIEARVILTLRKMKTVMPSLKAAFLKVGSAGRMSGVRDCLADCLGSANFSRTKNLEDTKLLIWHP